MSIRLCLHSVLQAEYKFLSPRLEPVGRMTALNWKPWYCIYSADPKLKALLKDRKYQFVLRSMLHPRVHRVNTHMLRGQRELVSCLSTEHHIEKGPGRRRASKLCHEHFNIHSPRLKLKKIVQWALS